MNYKDSNSFRKKKGKLIHNLIEFLTISHFDLKKTFSYNGLKIN